MGYCWKADAISFFTFSVFVFVEKQTILLLRYTFSFPITAMQILRYIFAVRVSHTRTLHVAVLQPRMHICHD